MRSKFILIFIGIMLFSLTFMSALDNFNCQTLESQKSLAIGQKIPDKAPFTDEIINLYLENQTYGNLILVNKTISDFSCSENENATYKVYVKNTSVIQKFMESNDSLQTYKNETSSGNIEIKGVGLGRQIKLFFAKIALNFIH